LFVGVLGNRLSPTILSTTFRRYTDAAGVAKHKRVTPHTLRHSGIGLGMYEGGSVADARPDAREWLRERAFGASGWTG
jgi:integrase